jgi:hypothetical protein
MMKGYYIIWTPGRENISLQDVIRTIERVKSP